MGFDTHCGTYALILRVNQSQEIPVGALGNLNFSPGFYIYVGSAFGPGGLRARLSHHLNPPEKKHWHIDYLRQQADIVDIWFTHDPVRREHEWAKEFEALPEIIIPFPGFGASDCQCNAHLFFMPPKPSLNDFYERLLVRHPDHEILLNSYPAVSGLR